MDRLGFSAFPPIQTERATFTALRFPVGFRSCFAPYPLEYFSAGQTPAQAFQPGVLVSLGLLRPVTPLVDLHPVPSITEGHLATTPPPSPVPHVGIFTSLSGKAASEFPDSAEGCYSVP